MEVTEIDIKVQQLTRVEGNSEELKFLAGKTCKDIAAGHVFVIYMKKAFPIHVTNTILSIPGVVNIYVATSNPLEILTAKTDLGISVVGVVDGPAAKNVEDDKQRQERKDLLKKLGFSLE